jgi:excisionase family DNA binding protein
MAHDLRIAVGEVLSASSKVSATAPAAFGRLVDVLETSEDAVVFPAGETVSTQQAAAVLGVSRMTVVRLVDRGELPAEGGGVHRRILVSALARYQEESARRRRAKVADLNEDIHDQAVPDTMIVTR